MSYQSTILVVQYVVEEVTHGKPNSLLGVVHVI